MYETPNVIGVQGFEIWFIDTQLGHEEVVDIFDFADLKSKQKSSEDLAIVDDADGVRKMMRLRTLSEKGRGNVHWQQEQVMEI
ncbi:hypothetical protein ACET3Z_009122 [Daucus carota]